MDYVKVSAAVVTSALVMAVAAGGLKAQSGRRAIDLEAGDCSQSNMTFDRDEIARAVQHMTVPAGSVAMLEVRPPANGGAKLIGGTGPNYSVTACISAGAPTLGEAQQRADSVRLSVDGQRVVVEGPDGAHWGVQLVVETPARANVSVVTTNGPIGIDGVSGHVEARAQNGPIGIRDSDGEVTAHASNGPISVAGSRGQFDVETQNGPISVELLGTRWDGELDARAHNGPLSLRVPDGYESGVEISSSSHSPWQCRADACRDATRDWDDRGKSLKIGAGATVVTMSTVNGPVSIQRGRD